MSNFKDVYPRVCHYLSIFSLENGLDFQQIKAVGTNSFNKDIALREELCAALSDDSVCWKDILVDPEIGEIDEAFSEEDAVNTVLEIFGVPESCKLE